MPIASSTFIRSTTILLITGFAALMLIVGLSFWLGHRAQIQFATVIEARDARAATTDLRSRVQDLETGQRGFLLTLEESYLVPYEEARRNLIPAYERMRAAMKFDPAIDRAMATLGNTIRQKVEETERTIELARQGQVEEAISIVRTDRGKALMDEARQLFEEVIRAADTRLFEASQEQRQAASLLQWATALGALVIFCVVGGSVWTSLAYTRELLATREKVEQLNAGLEERVRERTIDLKRANEEVQRFAYIVTHDLRAPLVNIMGFTSELEASLKSISAAAAKNNPAPSDPVEMEAHRAATEDLPEAISFIRASTQKMDGLINAILKLSREGRRPLVPERIELKALIDRAAGAVQHQVSEADGAVETEIGAATVISDRLSLEQIIGNLIDNAVKYRDTTRPLSVRVRTFPETGRTIAIEVEDNGRGIAEQDHERVFELFRRSGVQDKPGEGIGLSYVRSLARSLGGDVAVRSSLGQGSVFTVTLPLDVRPIVEASRESDRKDQAT